MNYQLDPELVCLARHEIGHAWLAAELGYSVAHVMINEAQGCTTVPGMQDPETFAERFAQSPIVAVQHLVQNVAILRAGAYVAALDGQFGGASSGSDLHHIERWHKVAMEVCGAEFWPLAYSAVASGLQGWTRHESVRSAIREMALALAANGRLSHHAFATALSVTGATSCPQPRFVVAVPPAQRSTPPAVRHTSAPAQEPDYEDAHSKGYIIDEQGDYTLLRIERKTTGTTKYVLGRQDGHGEWASLEYPSEAAGRRALQRVMKGERVA